MLSIPTQSGAQPALIDELAGGRADVWVFASFVIIFSCCAFLIRELERVGHSRESGRFMRLQLETAEHPKMLGSNCCCSLSNDPALDNCCLFAAFCHVLFCSALLGGRRALFHRAEHLHRAAFTRSSSRVASGRETEIIAVSINWSRHCGELNWGSGFARFCACERSNVNETVHWRTALRVELAVQTPEWPQAITGNHPVSSSVSPRAYYLPSLCVCACVRVISNNSRHKGITSEKGN